MPQTGDRVQHPGVYSSRCCSYENSLGLDQEFPMCGTCSRPTQWAAVTPGHTSPDDKERRIA
jgi:hypothetical protein